MRSFIVVSDMFVNGPNAATLPRWMAFCFNSGLLKRIQRVNRLVNRHKLVSASLTGGPDVAYAINGTAHWRSDVRRQMARDGFVVIDTGKRDVFDDPVGWLPGIRELKGVEYVVHTRAVTNHFEFAVELADFAGEAATQSIRTDLSCGVVKY